MTRREAPDEPASERPAVQPSRWGPASWWRIGLVAMAAMILVLLVSRFIG